MFLEYSKDVFIFFGLIFYPSVANLNIIFYYVCAQFVGLRASRYSKYLWINCFFLTCWLKPNRIFSSGQLFIILPQNQVLDSNSQYRADDNNNFTIKKNKKARCMDFLTKAMAICAGKKASHYCQNNDQGGKLWLIGLNQWIL